MHYSSSLIVASFLQASSAKVQEDLEAEFQSLTSVLEELKESMLMKIKQDRASRTYELQVRPYTHTLFPEPLVPS